MLIVKIMCGGEDAADEDTRKQHRLICVPQDGQIEFTRDPEGRAYCTITVPEAQRESWPLVGNVYVMNERGVTISSFGCAPILSSVELADIYVNGHPLTLPAKLRGPCDAADLRDFITDNLPDTEGHILAHDTPNGIEVMLPTGNCFPGGRYVTIPSTEAAAIRDYPGA